MAVTESSGIPLLQSSKGRMALSAVPLARRNILANKKRLIRSIAGITFAVLLMIVELGFRNAFIDSMLLVIRRLDGDIMLVSSAKYQFDRRARFSRRQFYEARAVAGVATVRPFYVEKNASVWKNPQDHRLFGVQAFAFDPNQPVLLIPEVTAKLDALRQPDTIMVDRDARRNLGKASAGTETELGRHKVRVVGTFALGPTFFSDGTVLMSDRNLFKLFGSGTSNPTDLPDVEIGIVKVLPGRKVSDVQKALRAAMPASVSVLTKAEFIDGEAKFHAQVSPVGPVFGVGTLVGFAVGMLISYQILFSELSDQLSQYATLKAMGYQNRYLVKVVLQQAALYALLGYVPAWILCYAIFRIIHEIVLLPMSMSVGLTVMTLALSVGMCVGSALIAVRRVVAADPAELF
jgi:putative ABC transport system permease protein